MTLPQNLSSSEACNVAGWGSQNSLLKKTEPYNLPRSEPLQLLIVVSAIGILVACQPEISNQLRQNFKGF